MQLKADLREALQLAAHEVPVASRVVRARIFFQHLGDERVAVGRGAPPALYELQEGPAVPGIFG